MGHSESAMTHFVWGDFAFSFLQYYTVKLLDH